MRGHRTPMKIRLFQKRYKLRLVLCLNSAKPFLIPCQIYLTPLGDQSSFKC